MKSSNRLYQALSQTNTRTNDGAEKDQEQEKVVLSMNRVQEESSEAVQVVMLELNKCVCSPEFRYGPSALRGLLIKHLTLTFYKGVFKCRC